jgi:hypothetical protein
MVAEFTDWSGIAFVFLSYKYGLMLHREQLLDTEWLIQPSPKTAVIS